MWGRGKLSLGCASGTPLVRVLQPDNRFETVRASALLSHGKHHGKIIAMWGANDFIDVMTDLLPPAGPVPPAVPLLGPFRIQHFVPILDPYRASQ